MTVVLSEMPIFWVIAVFEVHVASCGSEHTLWCPGYTPFVRTSTPKLKTTGWYVDVLRIE